MSEGFEQRGHYEPVTPTPEQVAAHKRALEIVAELQTNPYILLGMRDEDPTVDDLVTERWVPDETDEEWLTRWRESKENS